MGKKWRRDQIQKSWTAEQWNEMYKKAEKGETDAEIDDWNEFYNTVKHKDDSDAARWNKIYNGEIDSDDSSDDE